MSFNLQLSYVAKVANQKIQCETIPFSMKYAILNFSRNYKYPGINLRNVHNLSMKEIFENLKDQKQHWNKWKDSLLEV